MAKTHTQGVVHAYIQTRGLNKPQIQVALCRWAVSGQTMLVPTVPDNLSRLKCHDALAGQTAMLLGLEGPIEIVGGKWITLW